MSECHGFEVELLILGWCDVPKISWDVVTMGAFSSCEHELTVDSVQISSTCLTIHLDLQASKD